MVFYNEIIILIIILNKFIYRNVHYMFFVGWDVKANEAKFKVTIMNNGDKPAKATD